MSQKLTSVSAAAPSSGAAPQAGVAAGGAPVEPALAGARGWRHAFLWAAEWILLLAAIGLWTASGNYSPQMSVGSALVAGSWLARWIRLGRLTRPTPLDIPVLLFLLSAMAAMWIAPDRTAALARFYLLLAAVALFYGLANAGPATLRLFAGLFVLAAAALGLYFALQNDWAANPAKLAFVGQLAGRLDGVLPDLGLYKPHPNVVAGILALAGPVALAAFVGEVRQAAKSFVRAIPGLIVFGLGGLLILFGSLMAESRTAWLALAAASALAVWWWLAEKLAGSLDIQLGDSGLFWAGIAAVVVTAAAVFVVRPDLLTLVLGSLPGPNSVVSRIEIYSQVWRLAQDMPFTGGGLDSFPSLYAFYILLIPSLFLTHAHNAYLNVLVEQGWPGLAGYAGLVIVGVWVAARAVRHQGAAPRSMIVGGALSMAVVALSGLGDGILVASRAAPTLLIPAGLVLAGWPDQPADVRPARPRLLMPALVGLAALALLASGVIFRRSLAAAWFANLGAVAQQRIDLAGGMSGEWRVGAGQALMSQAEPYFQRAVQYQPSNRAAAYRLGLIALVQREFRPASAWLEQAYQADPNHRGVIKALGFTYVWLGDFDSAESMLVSIPEAESELSVYVWWWGTQGRPDLSRRAREMVSRLQS